MGAFADFFGTSPRVWVVEAFAENPDDELSVPEIVRITGVSKRAAYMHVRKLVDEGILVESSKRGKCNYYRFNEMDTRGQALTFLERALVLGGLERQIRLDEGIPFKEPFPYRRRERKVWEIEASLEVPEAVNVFAEAAGIFAEAANRLVHRQKVPVRPSTPPRGSLMEASLGYKFDTAATGIEETLRAA